MVTIRKAILNDLAQIFDLEKKIFTPAFSHEDLHRELTKNPYSLTTVLLEQEKIIGFSILWTLFEQAQIVQIAIDNDFRNRGYGKLLMENMICNAKQKGCEFISLEVRVSNNDASNFYNRFHFKKATIRKNYYKDPSEDGILMWRSLL